MDRVLVRHATDGREFDIPKSAFETPGLVRLDDGSFASYAAAGFVIVSYADGSAHEPQPAQDSGYEPQSEQDDRDNEGEGVI